MNVSADLYSAESAPASGSGQSPAASGQFAASLLSWFDRAGRKHLPWQQQTTPYRVWISEIMLQQTQVATVIPYYQRFMERFPDVHTLAAASIDEVLHLWTGLGYYARARNLHRAAQIVVADYSGDFPHTIEAVRALPGIGRSTAAAVLALSCSQRHAILDGNVKRVLARFFAVHGFPGDATVEHELWSLADACTPHERVANYTQAIMDLGATVCVRSRPLCVMCPVSKGCAARIRSLQHVLPTPRPKKDRPRRAAYAMILMRADGAILLEQRPPTGLWGSLWTFPQFEQQDAALQWLGRFAAVGLSSIERSLPPYRHSFTHFDLTLQPWLVRLPQIPDGIAEAGKVLWYDPAKPAQIGLTKPAVELITKLAALT